MKDLLAFFGHIICIPSLRKAASSFNNFFNWFSLFTGEFCARTTLRSLSRGLIRKHINGEQYSDKTLHAERLQRKRIGLETVEVDPQSSVSVLTEKRV